jgi:hypothetical protein
MSTQGGKPLTEVPGWSPAHAEALAKNWITTAEQVVGMAATPGGVEALAQEVGVPEETMRALDDLARSALAPSVARGLAKPVDASEYGLGALPPDEPKRPRRRRGSDK